jgi:type IV pilus assembly protein PilX
MSTRRLPSPPRRERGAILVLALMFLVLLTIIGVSSISGVTLEEKMAGNLRNQNMAFQAAESALRDAEIDLEAAIGATTGTNPICTAPCPRDPIKIAPHFATKCNAAFTGGVCRADATTGGFQTEIVTAVGWDWTHADKTVEYGRYTGAKALPNVARQPRYVIEWLQEKDDTTTTPFTRHFRITARGWGGVEVSTVTLQTVYRMTMETGP